MFTEQSSGTRVLIIQDVHQRISIFTERSCVNNDLIELLHFDQEFHGTRSHQNIYFESLAVYLNWEHDAWVSWWFETRMDECFIKIKNQRLLSFAPGALRTQHATVQSLLYIQEWNLSWRRWTNDSSCWNLRHRFTLWHLSNQVAELLRSLIRLVSWLRPHLIWIIVSGRTLSLEVMTCRICALN